MKRVRFSTLALADLESISTFIRRDSEGAARRVVNRIEEACFSLQKFAELGVTSVVPRARKLFVPGLPYKIIYQIVRKTHTVVILRVYHGAQDTRW